MFNNWQKMKLGELVFSGLIVGLLAVSGCATRGGVLGVDCCADAPAGSIPEPAGAKVCNWQSAQIAGAVADQAVLYQADFYGRSSTLSPGAIDRLARNANSGLVDMQPVLIQPSSDDALDAERVFVVKRQLESFDVAAPMVEIATPAALGMRGLQAEQVASGSGVF